MASKSRSTRRAPARKTDEQWDPTGASFSSGEPYFKKTLRDAGLDMNADVFTSRHPAAKRTMKAFKLSNVPSGFTKWQIPFALRQPTNFYITIGKPNAKVTHHAHGHGAGFRVVVKGSLAVNGTKLEAGDWFYVPEGKPYEYSVGPKGVQLMSGYECCCQGWPCC